MVDDNKLKAYADKCKTFSDADLEFRSSREGTSEYQRIALEEIYRRKEIKENKANKTQNNIKYLTIIILFLTLLALIVGIMQLLK